MVRFLEVLILLLMAQVSTLDRNAGKDEFKKNSTSNFLRSTICQGNGKTRIRRPLIRIINILF